MGYKITGGGGAVFYQDAPPPAQPPSTTSSTGRVEQAHRRRGVRSGRVRGGQPGNGLKPVGRRAAIEGSLLLTVLGSLGAERIWRFGGGGGYQKRVGKGGRGVPGARGQGW